MDKGGYVYIMTTRRNSVLYVGVTSQLFDRALKHIQKFYPRSFTAKYNVDKLVYYQWFPSIEEAIAFEKKLKAGPRKRKTDLISKCNPSWSDLFIDLSNRT